MYICVYICIYIHMYNRQVWMIKEPPHTPLIVFIARQLHSHIGAANFIIARLPWKSVMLRYVDMIIDVF